MQGRYNIRMVKWVKQVLYKSTRDNKINLTSSEAILKGIADDGGLFVPDEFPQMEIDWDYLSSLNYKELAFDILKLFLTDFTEEELKYCINSAYDEKFDTKVIAPLTKKMGAYFLELYHGPTLAFKDMALSILPYFIKISAKKNNVNKKICILTATSGDTGKAALEGFSDVEGTKIIVFYPVNGVSEIQKRQMVTQEGNNTEVIAINGNFDDAQTGVKEIFNNKEILEELEEKGYLFSSANSINIGRLLPQIVYYFYSYIQLLKNGEIGKGDKINFTVPTGNFGNILAGYYAKKLGLPINKLICASNINNILFDFLSTGMYDKRRDLNLTVSPSMDIIVSSNLERLLYNISGNDSEYVNNLMNALYKAGYYKIDSKIKKGLEDFYGGYAKEDETLKSIKEVFEKEHYLIDTHTAVAYSVYKGYKAETNDDTKTVILSTASPFKFPKSVINAINTEISGADDFSLIKIISEFSGVTIPKGIINIEKKQILHNKLCNKEEMMQSVKDSLN